jgi:transcription elongation factor Elf1
MPGTKQTHCRKGHAMAGDNLYLHGGFRYCRQCRREANLRWLAGAAVPKSEMVATKDAVGYSRTYEKANYSHRLDLKRTRRKRIRAWYRAYKASVSCVRCGENHSACINFHHVNPSNKDRDVARLAGDGVTEVRILKEIEKCIVLCANCHAKEHWKEETL